MVYRAFSSRTPMSCNHLVSSWKFYRATTANNLLRTLPTEVLFGPNCLEAVWIAWQSQKSYGTLESCTWLPTFSRIVIYTESSSRVPYMAYNNINSVIDSVKVSGVAFDMVLSGSRSQRPTVNPIIWHKQKPCAQITRASVSVSMPGGTLFSDARSSCRSGGGFLKTPVHKQYLALQNL